MLLHFVVSGKEAMIQLPQPQYTTFNIDYRWAIHGIKKSCCKKSCCKGVDGGFSNFGFLLQDFIYNATKGQDTKWEMKVKPNMASL
jgi:hypothetical protein